MDNCHVNKIDFTTSCSIEFHFCHVHVLHEFEITVFDYIKKYLQYILISNKA
jgi:hypothetical protein